MPFVSISTVGIVLDSPHEEAFGCCAPRPRVCGSGVCLDYASPSSPPPSPPQQSLELHQLGLKIGATLQFGEKLNELAVL
jgi:hypothetical protein